MVEAEAARQDSQADHHKMEMGPCHPANLALVSDAPKMGLLVLPRHVVGYDLCVDPQYAPHWGRFVAVPHSELE